MKNKTEQTGVGLDAVVMANFDSFSDDLEHDTDSETCWCNPIVEDYTAMGGGKLIIHRDNRC